ncbi:MAG TPA: Wzz/FepE/Etk N-terminal domain-containing protein [Thermoclostridium sp.]|nr:Wzz/FepE/Etk N-terminal domain-containing protein [Thermoclostridium sp.]
MQQEPYNDFMEIDLKEIIYMLIRKWWIIAIFFAIAVATSFIVSFHFIQPVYKAETTLFVGKEGNKSGAIELGEIKLNDELVSDYREIIKSRLAAREVIERLNIDISIESFQDHIEVTTASNSRLMKIACKSTDPQLAVNIANALSDFIIVKAEEIMEVDNVKIIDQAELPTRPIKPNKKMNLAIAAVIGIMIGVGLIFLIEYLDSTIKDKKDVVRYLDINVIGEIPEFDGEERGYKRGKTYKRYYGYR